jgi:inhibitor of Bruton tyrosine kinase
MVAKEWRSLRDIQAEEAELQAEVEFMKWWTAEEERIRLENEAMLTSLTQPKKPRQDRPHHIGKTNKKSAGIPESDVAADRRAARDGERKRKAPERVSHDATKGTSRG